LPSAFGSFLLFCAFLAISLAASDSEVGLVVAAAFDEWFNMIYFPVVAYFQSRFTTCLITQASIVYLLRLSLVCVVFFAVVPFAF
jgi:hypothetical protein